MKASVITREEIEALPDGRLAHDVTDYPAKGKRLYRNRSMAWNLVDIENIVER